MIISRGVALLLAGLAVAVPSRASGQAAGALPRLETAPQLVYKLADPGRAEMESWVVTVLVVDDANRNGTRAVRAEVDVLARGRVLESRILGESALDVMRATSFKVLPETHRLALKRIYQRDELFDLRFEFPARPLSWHADAIQVRLTLDVPGTGRVVRTLDSRLLTYEQRTTLRFPLQSPSIVTQGPFNNSGHASYTNQFAIDVMGLGAAYGPMGGSGAGNKEFAGFGATVMAPASGRVVYARNDVPDNEPGQDSEAVYGAQREPLMATAGNAVIIDHGNGEYSTLMHLQRGSVTVSAGDSVRVGQPIARIGNSGDSFQPHLHFQLQNGPELFRATTVPVTFTNLDARSLARGEYLSPR